jgi:5-formyltetrahydrofolate cyclo-ligase
MTVDLNFVRRQIQIKIQSLTLQSRAISSQKIATKILQSEIFIRSQNIGCYVPLENEVDTWSIIKGIWAAGKNCYLPAFSPKDKKSLCFVKFILGDQLLKTKYKILEPKIVSGKILAPEDLDLVIVPLRGFNRDRFRLGCGMGCYDRTFSFKKRTQVFSKPCLIGLGFECQQVEFEPEPWDVVMDEIVSA